MPAVILSLDFGTKLTKAVLFVLQYQELAVVERIYQLSTHQPDWAKLALEEM